MCYVAKLYQSKTHLNKVIYSMVLGNSKKKPKNDQVINTDYTREEKEIIEVWQVALATVCSTTALKKNLSHILQQKLGF